MYILLLLYTSYYYCVHLTITVYILLLLCTSYYYYKHLSITVYILLLLYTFYYYCKHLTITVYILVLLCKSYCYSVHLTVVVYILLSLYTLLVRWVVGSILHGVDPLSYFSFQPVLHDWCNKGRGMCYPVCEMVPVTQSPNVSLSCYLSSSFVFRSLTK